jgi:hypothetical protein
VGLYKTGKLEDMYRERIKTICTVPCSGVLIKIHLH